MLTETTAARLDTQIWLMDSLLDEVASGRLRIPTFQRPFVWRPDQMLDLFDSIEKGYPIGSLLLWQTDKPVPTLTGIGDVELPPPADGRQVSYLLDGHQRVSTLFGTLRRGQDAARSAATKDWKWWIYRDLRSSDRDSRSETVSDRYRHQRGAEEPPPHFLPLRAVSRTMDFLEFSRRIESDPAVRPRIAELIREAETVVQQIKSFQIPVIRLMGGDLDRAVEVYTRLNRKGTRIEPDQMVSALAYHSDARPPLASRVDEIIAGVADTGFGAVPRLLVFRAVLAIAGEKDIMTARWEAVAGRLADKVNDAVPETDRAIRAAVTFLREYVGLPLARLLPYAHQLTVLAAFFHARPTPTQEQQYGLRRWFWTTSWANAFAGANSTMIRNALDEMKNYAAGANGLDLSGYQPQPVPDSFNLNSARTRAYVTWEMIEFPKRLDPIHLKIDVVKLVASGESHVFRQIFSGLPHPANRIIMPTNPGMSAREALADMPTSDPDPVLESHGIPVAAWQRLMEGNGPEFIRSRAAFLESRIQRFAADCGVSLPGEVEGGSDDDTE